MDQPNKFVFKPFSAIRRILRRRNVEDGDDGEEDFLSDLELGDALSPTYYIHKDQKSSDSRMIQGNKSAVDKSVVDGSETDKTRIEKSVVDMSNAKEQEEGGVDDKTDLLDDSAIWESLRKRKLEGFQGKEPSTQVKSDPSSKVQENRRNGSKNFDQSDTALLDGDEEMELKKRDVSPKSKSSTPEIEEPKLASAEDVERLKRLFNLDSAKDQ